MIKLYSTGCPQCDIIKTRLDNKKLKYEYVDCLDKPEIIEQIALRGAASMPVLEMEDGTFMSFAKILPWINQQK